MRWAAHEFLETQEALRSKAATIELYGALMGMTQDAHLRDILQNQQRREIQAYQQGVNLLLGKGVQMQAPHTPQMNVYEQPQVGLQQPTMSAPNPQATKLSDMSISTVLLNLHKSGAAVAMLWACECVDPQVRTYHATCANVCQEMAYELWQFMNYKGYYQAPQLADHTMNTMIRPFQGQNMTSMMM
ncbi:spore coat protein [Ammoniphilus sp. CFH 90114]|uniref:spore coat protein n=1 Tax=Ammoniphilus sp. CFH 90114 TaxID=2493665 RepID=UPI00100F4D7E|nr:spore coat protein [Ammoniphilus sp. CFH 90114]RXT06316.1 spore coat protein [Ammoniphilus sp. CFH 90114]